MSKEMVTVDAANIPAHLLNRGRKGRNAEALAGLSTGGVSSIRAKNGRFRIKEAGSDDVAIPIAELADGQYLPVVITGIRTEVNKTYFAKPYDADAEGEAAAPDCFSLDGVAPDVNVENPICTSCAGCPMNAFNTGRNQAGQPTKGKACADTKVFAVLYRNKVYSMKVMPASLKNFATYIRELDRHDLDYSSVITFISLDEKADFPQLVFRVGRYLTEEALVKIDPICEGPDTHAIMNPTPFVKEAKQLPAETKEEVDPAIAEAAAKAEKKRIAAEKKAAKAAKDAAKVEVVDKDAGADATDVSPTDEAALPSDDDIDSLLDLG